MDIIFFYKMHKNSIHTHIRGFFISRGEPPQNKLKHLFILFGFGQNGIGLSIDGIGNRRNEPGKIAMQTRLQNGGTYYTAVGKINAVPIMFLEVMITKCRVTVMLWFLRDYWILHRLK